MAYTQADLDRICAAIAEGVLTVEVDGERITYRSIDDLLKAKANIEGSLSIAAGGTRHSVASFSRD